jgi:hypothetical protein
MNKNITLPILILLKLDAYAEEQDSCPSRVIERLLLRHWREVGFKWDFDDHDEDEG